VVDCYRYAYRNIWKSSLSEKNKTADSKRNKHCPAILEIKIKLITKDTRKKDPLIGRNDPPLPGIITLIGLHNHKLDRSDAMKFLRGGEELKKTFISYFNDGHPPHVARALHYEKLRQMKDGPKLVADAHLNPLKNTVYYWHKEWREKNFGDAVDPIEKLKEKIETYEKGKFLRWI
jgi:hypothetical protein